MQFITATYYFNNGFDKETKDRQRKMKHTKSLFDISEVINRDISTIMNDISSS